MTAHDIDEARQIQIATQSVFRIDDRQLVQSDVTEFRLFFPQELRYFLETNAFGSCASTATSTSTALHWAARG